jgi:putative endonuclease
MSTRELGRWGERLARAYLLGKGYRVIEVGWRAGRLGEIDLIVRRGMYLAFVEVKARRGRRYGTPEEAVGVPKRRKLILLGEAFLARLPPRSSLRRLQPRFDVIAVEPGGLAGWRVRHLIGAFDASDGATPARDRMA